MVEQRPRDVAEALQTLLRRQLATPTTRCEVRRFEGPPPLRRLRPLRGGLRRGRSSAMGAGSLTARFAQARLGMHSSTAALKPALLGTGAAPPARGAGHGREDLSRAGIRRPPAR